MYLRIYPTQERRLLWGWGGMGVEMKGKRQTRKGLCTGESLAPTAEACRLPAPRYLKGKSHESSSKCPLACMCLQWKPPAVSTTAMGQIPLALSEGRGIFLMDKLR